MIVTFEQMLKDHNADVKVMAELETRRGDAYTRSTYMWRAAFGFGTDAQSKEAQIVRAGLARRWG